jgi:DNA-binding transcriptional ArsR family regulator
MCTDSDSDIATIAATLSDPAQVRMMSALMDGRARTAIELAPDGDVAASTASAHLSQLVDAGLVAQVRQGPHRYFSIADPTVAAGIEGLLRMADTADANAASFGPRDRALREARVCYDHLAGTLGVALKTRMVEAGYLIASGESATLTDEGERWLERIGIDVRTLHAQRRPICRTCMDWSERRMHLAGGVGAGLLRMTLGLGYLERIAGSRALVVTARGRRFVETLGVSG